MQRAIVYRIYPTKEQAVLILKTCGCARKVWNLMLETREKAYREEKKTVYPRPAQYKEEYPFLKEADSLALCNAQLALEQAYRRFFSVKGTGHPKFKAKKNGQSYTTNNNTGNSIRLGARHIRLPKLGKVKAKLHRLPGTNWQLKSATVKANADGTFECSVLFSYEKTITPARHPEYNAVGLDYKSDGFYVSSDGITCGSPKFFRKSQKRLAKDQRKLRNKEKGSNNYKKACERIAKDHKHIANQRKDFCHKESDEIANHYDLVCIESIDLKSIANKGFRNGKATNDNGYGMFIDFLEYKLEERGKKLIRIDKWYPSSQTCSACGHVNKEVKDLTVRKWVCPECGTEHDRDINAAINIKTEGIRVFLGS